MTIDNNLLRQALELQKQVGREPWMDDIQTIRAMRAKRVEWGIIYALIAQKHSLEISQEIFERSANRLLRSLKASSKKKKSNAVSQPNRIVQGTTEVTPEGTTQVTLEGTTQVTPEGTVEGTFKDLENLNPIS